MSSFFETSSGLDDFASTFDAVKTMSDLSKPVQQHLVKVYATLAGLCLVSAAGAYLHVAQWFGGGVLSFFLGLASVFGIMYLPDTPGNKSVRFALLFNFAIMQGLSIGPLIDYALHIDTTGGLVINACILTALVFVSFTLSAMFNERRTFLFLGGIFGSALSMLMWLSFLNIYIGSKMLFSLELYMGLFLFCGYVLYDTQLILYRALMGSRDVVRHALDLFIDLIGLLTRILITLVRNQEEREHKKRRSKR